MPREHHRWFEGSNSRQPLRVSCASDDLPTSPEPCVVEFACKPGHSAPASGIYRVVHKLHRAPHEVVLLRGEELPTCRSCKVDVTFTLVEAVEHVTHDMDFAGPILPWERAA